jgi:hypothetical protein
MFSSNHTPKLRHIRDMDLVAQISIKFKSQLNLKRKLILCTFRILCVN